MVLVQHLFGPHLWWLPCAAAVTPTLPARCAWTWTWLPRFATVTPVLSSRPPFRAAAVAPALPSRLTATGSSLQGFASGEPNSLSKWAPHVVEAVASTVQVRPTLHIIRYTGVRQERHAERLLLYGVVRPILGTQTVSVPSLSNVSVPIILLEHSH